MAHNAHPVPTRLGAITDDPVAVAEECRLPGAVDGGGEQNAFSLIDAPAERCSGVRSPIQGLQRRRMRPRHCDLLMLRNNVPHATLQVAHLNV